MPIHREFFGAVSGGIGALGGFLGDVGGAAGGFARDIFGGARERLFPDPSFIGPPGPATGGFAERLGGFLAERAVPFLFPTRGPKALCIIGPCEPLTGFPDRGPLPRTSQVSIVPTIPKSPGTLGAIPFTPKLGAPQPFDIGRQPAAVGDPVLAGLGLPMGLPALALAGGAAIGRQLPGLFGGLALSELFGGGGGGEVDLPFQGRFFNRTMAGVRAKSLVRLQNPVTGSDVWFRNVGQPILFAGDFATVKRVRRIAATAHRRIGHRRGR